MIRILRELLSFIMGIVEVLLIFRFLLKLLAANPEASFVAWIYESTQPLLQPFLRAFPESSVQGGFTLEFTTLFAIFVYAFVGYLLQESLDLLESRKRS